MHALCSFKYVLSSSNLIKCEGLDGCFTKLCTDAKILAATSRDGNNNTYLIAPTQICTGARSGLWIVSDGGDEKLWELCPM